MLIELKKIRYGQIKSYEQIRKLWNSKFYWFLRGDHRNFVDTEDEGKSFYFAISSAAAHLQRLVLFIVFHPRIKKLVISFNIILYENNSPTRICNNSNLRIRSSIGYSARKCSGSNPLEVWILQTSFLESLYWCSLARIMSLLICYFEHLDQGLTYCGFWWISKFFFWKSGQ